MNNGNGLALDLFVGGYETPSFAANGFLAYDDFLELGVRLGLPPSRVRRLLADVVGYEAAILALLEKSFIPPARRDQYATNTRPSWPAVGSGYATRWPARVSRWPGFCV